MAEWSGRQKKVIRKLRKLVETGQHTGKIQDCPACNAYDSNCCKSCPAHIAWKDCVPKGTGYIEGLPSDKKLALIEELENFHNKS